MLTRLEALEILRLKDEDAVLEKIESAFLRLARRYPPEVFPQKFARIREARTVLTGADDVWKSFFEGDEIVPLNVEVMPAAKSASGALTAGFSRGDREDYLKIARCCQRMRAL